MRESCPGQDATISKPFFYSGFWLLSGFGENQGGNLYDACYAPTQPQAPSLTVHLNHDQVALRNFMSRVPAGLNLLPVNSKQQCLTFT